MSEEKLSKEELELVLTEATKFAAYSKNSSGLEENIDLVECFEKAFDSIAAKVIEYRGRS